MTDPLDTLASIMRPIDVAEKDMIDRLTELLTIEKMRTDEVRRAERAFALIDRVVSVLAAAGQEARDADELKLRLILSNVLLAALPAAADARAILAGAEPAPRGKRTLFAVAKAGD